MKKVVIDAGHGGSDIGNSGNGINEKEYALLISNYMKQRLDDLGINNLVTRGTDRNLSIDERIGIIDNYYNLGDDVLVVSNHFNKGGNSGLEVIYALRNKDTFAKKIADNVEGAGLSVNKYYQLRNTSDTSRDYYPLIADTPRYETVMIEYGYVDNLKDANSIKNNYEDYSEAVVKSIADYIGVSYMPPSDSDYYVVKKGDSLWKISTSFGINVDELKNYNNLTSNNLSIGQLLKIPGQKKESGLTYIVKSGDTLWKIANTYKVSVSDLKSANNLTSDLLSIGQQLIIPGSLSNNNVKYIVKSGDTLWKIANTYKVTVDSLKKANNLTGNILSIGQKLTIPNA